MPDARRPTNEQPERTNDVREDCEFVGNAADGTFSPFSNLMRVISGSAKGHRLTAPKSPLVRPALDKIKEAIFDILFDVSGTRVLDLFAGSGSVGIEALSRGALSAVFVETWSEAIRHIHKNLEHCKLERNVKIMKCDVRDAITRLARTNEQFDLIFVDPPYLKDLVKKTLRQISRSNIIHENSLIIVEHHPKEPIGEIEGLGLTDSRKYGQTLISFLKREEVKIK